MSDSPDQGHASAGDESLVQAFVEDRFVEMFLSQNRRAQLGLLAAACVVCAVWFGALHGLVALLWWAAAAGVTAWRFVASEAWVRKGEAGARTGRIGLLLLANGVLMALPLLAFDRLSELQRAALSMILMTSATASVATTSGFRSVFVLFAAPMLIPLALAWAWVAWHGSGGAAWGLALLIGGYPLFLRGIGAQAQAVFEESSRFRYGEKQLNRQLTRALNEASEANRAKTQFLAAASHDLRQPIHSMNVLVAALGLRPLEPQSREIVNLLGTVNQSLSSQLDTLLDVSKLDAGVIQAELKVQPLDAIVRGLHATTVAVASQRGLRLELDVSAQPPHVLTDEALFSRTVSNLLDNALKFTPAGGVVRLSVRSAGPRALVEVADTGIGIAPEEQERVFGEFYQVGNVERDRQKGLGLGLSIVRRLCALLDVELSLQSRPGAGTTVTLSLPIAQALKPAAPVLVAQAGGLRGLRVLVVDDEAMVRQSMSMLLTELGCSTQLADGVDAAVRLAAAHDFDVVLSDLRLRGGESGLAAVSAVQALQPDVQAVLITGDTAPDRIREARAAGLRLLYKPVTLNDLIAALPGC
jgi:signal transduction histidine kinase